MMYLSVVVWMAVVAALAGSTAAMTGRDMVMAAGQAVGSRHMFSKYQFVHELAMQQSLPNLTPQYVSVSVWSFCC